LAIPYDYNGKYFKATVMNFPLGGQFNSRLNLNLREDKGFTYGIYSSFQGSKNAGPFAIGAGVRASSTDSSLKEIFYELNKYRNEGIKDDELAFAKKSLSQSDALQYENPFQKAQFLSLIANYNLPKNYQEEQNKILQSLTKEEINALAKELLPTDKMIIVIVGDKEKIQGPLQKLGYKIVDMKMD
jgi:zinc protease